jgi:hypothetical protein
MPEGGKRYWEIEYDGRLFPWRPVHTEDESDVPSLIRGAMTTSEARSNGKVERKRAVAGRQWSRHRRRDGAVELQAFPFMYGVPHSQRCEPSCPTRRIQRWTLRPRPDQTARHLVWGMK